MGEVIQLDILKDEEWCGGPLLHFHSLTSQILKISMKLSTEFDRLQNFKGLAKQV